MVGVYFDETYPDSAIDFTYGEISQSDYLSGYNQALKDSKATDMLEMLRTCHAFFEISNQHIFKENIEKLIKEIKL